MSKNPTVLEFLGLNSYGERAVCPHGYTERDLEDGTVSCESCEALRDVGFTGLRATGYILDDPLNQENTKMKPGPYRSATHGNIPLSIRGRELMQNLRVCVGDALRTRDWHTKDDQLFRARGDIAQYMSELEAKKAPPAPTARISSKPSVSLSAMALSARRRYSRTSGPKCSTRSTARLRRFVASLRRRPSCRWPAFSSTSRHHPRRAP